METQAGWRRAATTATCAVALLAPGPWAPGAGAAEEPVAAVVARPERHAFIGQWTLNVDLSEDPQEKMREAMEARMQQGGGGGGRGGGMGRGGGGKGGGGRGGGPGRGSNGESRRPPAMAFFAATELTIPHVAPAVAIVEPDGLVRTLQPDGEKYQVEHGEGEVKTRWEGDRLVVETKNERGKMKETWAVSPQTGRLTVQLEIEPGGGRMPKVAVRRVYEPAERTVAPGS